MPLGASRLKKFVLVSGVLFVASIGFISCSKAAKPKDPPSGLDTRVLASQSVTAGSTFGSLVIVNGYNDTLPRVAGIGAGTLNYARADGYFRKPGDCDCLRCGHQ